MNTVTKRQPTIDEEMAELCLLISICIYPELSRRLNLLSCEANQLREKAMVTVRENCNPV